MRLPLRKVSQNGTCIAVLTVMGKFYGAAILCLLLSACGSQDAVEVTSKSSEATNRSTQVTPPATIEPAKNFLESTCSRIDYVGLQISSDEGCWTEFIYYNNDGQKVALHFYPTHGNSGGRISTIVEHENRNLKIYSEIDFQDIKARALDMAEQTLTDEEQTRLKNRPIILNLSKLTVTSSKTCVDARGTEPLTGVISICTSGEPIIAYFVK